MTLKWDAENRRFVVRRGDREVSRVDLDEHDLIDVTSEDTRQCLRDMQDKGEKDPVIIITCGAPHPNQLSDKEVEMIERSSSLPDVTVLSLIVIALHLHENDIDIIAYITVMNPIAKDEQDVRDKVLSYIEATGGTFLEARWSASDECRVEIIPRAEWGHLDELFEIASNLWTMLRHGFANPETLGGAYALIGSGHPEALLGQPESEWLDVKRDNYGLHHNGQKYELACDVTAFANCYSGGMIIIGMGSEIDSFGRDAIARISPIKAGSTQPQRIMQILHELVTPPIEGLRVDAVPYRGREFGVIRVPSQPEAIKPFLVKGALFGDSLDKRFFSIPHRRSDQKLSMSAESVHSMLVTARAIMNMNTE